MDVVFGNLVRYAHRFTHPTRLRHSISSTTRIVEGRFVIDIGELTFQFDGYELVFTDLKNFPSESYVNSAMAEASSLIGIESRVDYNRVKGRTLSASASSYFARLRELKPEKTCTLVRIADKNRDISQKTIRDIKISEVLDTEGQFLSKEKLANIFAAQENQSPRIVRSSQAHDNPWLLVLRICPPTMDRPGWRCELCGADANDPSVVIGEHNIDSSSLNPQQQVSLLESIHEERQRVENLWGPLTRVSSPETEIAITVDELLLLIREAMSSLTKNDVTVRLPKELIRPTVDRLLQKRWVVLDTLPRKPGVLNRQAILTLQQHLAIDGETLTLDELEQMASLREPLIEVRGKWLYVDSKFTVELQKIAQHIIDFSVESLPAEEIVRKLLWEEIRYASGAELLPPEQILEATGFQELMQSIQELTPPHISPPKGLEATLRDYQQSGFEWLSMLSSYGLGGCLADDMGLGKTIQTLAWLQSMKESGITEPALLICPTSVMTNWEREAKKFTPDLRTYRHHGAKRPTTELEFFKARQNRNLVVTSYNLLHRDLELFQKFSWSAIILDEAQNIKNPQTDQSQAARALSSVASMRLALTGTPVENGPRDLWPIMEFLNPGMLGTWDQYVKNIAAPVEQERGNERKSDLREKIQPFILRRMKTDPNIAPELPEKIEQIVWCSLTRQQAAWYKAAINNAEKALCSPDKEERQGAILSVLTKLKQVCIGVAVLQGDHSEFDTRAGKIQRLTEMLVSVVENDEKAIVFSQYPDQLFDKLAELIEETFDDELKDKKLGVLTFSGSDSPKAREEKQKRFTEDPRFPVMLISLKAGGTGLNLQAANHVFHLDRWWTAAVEDQATDRAWRIGQEKIVHVHKFVCPGTLEERIDELISKKRNFARELLGDVEEKAKSVLQSLMNCDQEKLYSVLRLDEEIAVNDD